MSLGQLLSQGGWAMYPIYLCSFVALFLFCERFFLFWQIRARDLIWLPTVLTKVEQRDWRTAQEYCGAVSHPIASVLQASLEMRQKRPDRVEAEAQRVGQQQLDRFERFLPLIAFIAQVAPLLGLLGTVIGMVRMFYGLQQAGMANVDASALSSGIWQALLTTAAGLIVAAPTLAAYVYLTARVDRFRNQMTDAVTQLLNSLPADQAAPSHTAGAQDVS